jgi:hypothetical protein
VRATLLTGALQEIAAGGLFERPKGPAPFVRKRKVEMGLGMTWAAETTR